MATYIVTFELKDTSRLAGLKEAMKVYGSFCPLTKHAWAIKTSSSAKEVREKLTLALGPGDQLFVIRSGTEGAWRNSFGEKHNEWLKNNL